MKKSRIKRTLCSIVLIIAMLAGMLWLPEGQQSKAAENVTNVTFEQYSGWMGDNGDGSLMLRLATQTSLSAYDGQKLRATVLVDGQEQLVDWIVAQVGAQWTLYTRLDVGNYIASSAKNIIVPAGTSFYLVSDGTEVLTAAADFAMAASSGAWTAGYTDAKFTMRWLENYQNGDTYVALNLDKSVSDLSTTYSSGTKFSSTVLVNGAEQKVTWEYIIAGDVQLIRSSYDVDSSNYISTDATRIEIPEGTYLLTQNGAKAPIRVTNEIVLTELGTNNWLEGCNDIGLSYRGVYPQSSYIQVQFNYTGDLSGITDSNVSVYLDTEIDGEIVSVRWQIDQANSRIYTIEYGNVVPTTATSVKICAGTYSAGYTGTSYTKPIRITNDVGVICVAGTWHDAATVRTVGAAYNEVVGMSNSTPQIKLTTDTVASDEWKGWFDGIVYVDEVEAKARFYFEPNTQTLLVGQNVGANDPSDEVMRALKDHKTVKILAQNQLVLTPVQGQPGPVVLNLSNDLVLKWNGSAYEEGTESYDISLTFEAVNTTAYADQGGYLQVRFKYEGDLSNIPSDVVTAYLATEIDGTVVDNVRWQIDKTNNRLYTTTYLSQVPADATSVKIYADTYSSGYTYTSGYNGETHNIPIHIMNDVGTQLVSGTWYDMNDVQEVHEVGATYKTVVKNADGKPQIQLTADSTNMEGWTGWFDGTVYVGDAEDALNARFYFDPNSQTIYIGQNDPADNVMSSMSSGKTIKIKAQTELSTIPGQNQTGPVVLNLPEDLILVYSQSNDSWYIQGQEPRDITTTVSYKRMWIPDGKEAYQLELAVDNYNELVSEYGLWSWFEGTMKVNGEDRVVAFQLGSDLFASIPSTQNTKAGIPLNATSIEIPADTVFKKVGDSSANPLKVTNRLSYVNISGAWYPEGQAPKEIETNISYRDIVEEAEAYRLHMTADNYDDLVEEFGEWTWFEGTIKVNGEDRVVAFNLGSKLFATFTSNQNTNAGIPLDATSIEIPAGTIFVDKDASTSSLLKVTKAVELEKEPVYGRWGIKGTVSTPTTFNDISVNVHTLNGVYIALGAQTEKNWLADIYGSGAYFYGAAVIGDPEQGVYTNENMRFNLSGDQLVTSTVKIGLMDSITIKSGTILWPSTECKSQVPIRIMTDVELTRDAEDDWVIKLNGKVVQIGEATPQAGGGSSQTGNNASDGTSPQTGDDASVLPYVAMLAMALTCIGMCIVLEIRKRKSNG